jgi:uncharacterized membrane protein YagU involved in acid resistance
MDWAGWAVFGIAATVTLTGIMVAAQLAGLSRMDIPLILGTMFTDNPDRARSFGFLVHVVNGQVFALGYAAAFAILGRAEWWIGALFGAWHGLAALVVIVPLASGVHPRMATNRSGPELHAVLEPPGLLALNYGRETPLVALVAHVTFGVILGTFLSP